MSSAKRIQGKLTTKKNSHSLKWLQITRINKTLLITGTFCMLIEFAEPTMTYCLSAKCNETADRILQNMDLGVDPCEDFYQYACGGWDKKNILKPSQNSMSNFQKLRKKIEGKLLEIIQSWNNSRNITKKKAYSYYASCMNEDERNNNKKGKDALLKFIKELGNTSLLGGTLATISDIKQSLEKSFSKFFLPCFMEIKLRLLNSSKAILKVCPEESIEDTKEYFLGSRKNVLENYKNLMQQTFKKLGSTLNDRQLQDKINDIIELETKIAEFFENSTMSTQTINLTVFEEKYNIFHWSQFLSTFFSSLNITLPANEEIELISEDYFLSLIDYIQSVNPDTLRNYIVWHGIFKTMDWASNDFRDPFIKFKKLNKVEVLEPRHCLEQMKKYTNLNILLSFDYLKTFSLHSLSEKKSLLKKILNHIQNETEKRLRKASWLDKESQKLVIDKLYKIKAYFLFPDFLLNETYVQHLLDDLDLNSSSYFGNNLMLLKLHKMYYYNLLRNPERFQIFVYDVYPFAVNIFYFDVSNSIYLPTVMTEKPLFDLERSMSLTYGEIGFQIAHEISHSFDSWGVQYDAFGNQKNILTNASTSKKIKLSQCFVEQYQKFKFYGEKINANVTLDENLADSFALQIAFGAYQSWVEQNKAPSLYPGLDLDDDQLFFLGMAQKFCYKSTKKYAIDIKDTTTHAPLPIRVRGSMQNSNDFAMAFNCQPNSKMNPTKKCKIV